MHFSLSLFDPRRGQRHSNCFVVEIHADGSTADPHIKLLFWFIIDLTAGVVDLKKLEYDILIDIVRDRLAYSFHVLVEFAESVSFRV